MEAAMIGTFLVSVVALVIAVLCCAWAKPVDGSRLNASPKHDGLSQFQLFTLALVRE
jgi:hypothetical protein